MDNGNKQMTKLIHAIGTCQILIDELCNIQDDAKLKRIGYFKYEIKRATSRYIKEMKAANIVLSQIWEMIPNEDFERYLDAKKELLNLVQESTFEDISQLTHQLKEVHSRYYLLDVFERMMNTHCIPTMRDAYRKELGYTLEQYNELKRMQELGYVPNYEQSKTA